MTINASEVAWVRYIVFIAVTAKLKLLNYGIIYSQKTTENPQGKENFNSVRL